MGIPFLELTGYLLSGARVGGLAEEEGAISPAFSNRVSRSRILRLRAAIAGDSSVVIDCRCKAVSDGAWEDAFEPWLSSFPESESESQIPTVSEMEGIRDDFDDRVGNVSGMLSACWCWKGS